MTRIWNDPKEFPAESLKGFTRAYADYVQPVFGGVVRSASSPEGEVALLVGGGSGHYPAFAGWVGPGMAHGAVCGNIFASPSNSQAESVARAADNGGGVIIMFGNYAGDVLQFSKAVQTLEKEGIRGDIMTITDDIASDKPENHRDRRGIAGDLMVVKVTGAAIAEGADFDEALRIAWKANDATRTLGVAYSGCTLPGNEEPLFEVPADTVALGLGIHGEPGISDHENMTADELAEMLIAEILKEEPTRGENGYDGRVAVLVNGLGATKYEELFVLLNSVAENLEGRGLTLVGPQAGEQVTSLDMAGVSLTLMFLDDELERLWLAPADTPAFRLSGDIKRGERREVKADGAGAAAAASFAKGSEASVRQGSQIVEILEAFMERMSSEEGYLGKLDSPAGDGDHGQGMVLGTIAAVRAAKAARDGGAGAATILNEAGKAWAEGAGGTSGALWGNAVQKLADLFSDDEEVTDVGPKLATATHYFAEYGRAEVGDKTMVDATEPFANTIDEKISDGGSLGDALADAVKAAFAGAESTKEFAAKKGRARTHGEKSIGHADPGAVSFAMLMETLANKLAK